MAVSVSSALSTDSAELEQPPLRRWAAGIEYQGTRFSGWQSQLGRASIQGTLETALARVANQPVLTVAAGRTDAGVHAAGQVVHFDTVVERSAYSWVLGTNSNLPQDVSLCWIQPVSADFDARRSAVRRRYRYVIHNQRARAALLTERATWVPQTLDAPPMHEAAQALIGEHDFSGFRAAECQSSTPMRRVFEISVARNHEFIVIDICANAFLHHMVRNIAGVLIQIGHGRKPVGWAAEILAGRDRTRASITAAARGLYFLGPEYPDAFGLPTPARAWFPG